MHEPLRLALGLWPRSGSTRQTATMVDFDGTVQRHCTRVDGQDFDATQDELARYLEAQLGFAKFSNEGNSP